MVTLSDVNPPNFVTSSVVLKPIKGCSYVGPAKPLLPFGEAKYSSNWIASSVFFEYLAIPPALILT